MIPYPDSSTPEYNQSCPGTGGVESAAFGCVYDPMNDALLEQPLHQQRLLQEPEQRRLRRAHPQHRPAVELLPGQHRTRTGLLAGEPRADPADLRRARRPRRRHRRRPARPGAVRHRERTRARRAWCTRRPPGSTCTRCPPGLPTMPNPCAGVPANAWCSGGKPVYDRPPGRPGSRPGSRLLDDVDVGRADRGAVEHGQVGEGVPLPREGADLGRRPAAGQRPVQGEGVGLQPDPVRARAERGGNPGVTSSTPGSRPLGEPRRSPRP